MQEAHEKENVRLAQEANEALIRMRGVRDKAEALMPKEAFDKFDVLFQAYTRAGLKASFAQTAGRSMFPQRSRIDPKMWIEASEDVDKAKQQRDALVALIRTTIDPETALVTLRHSKRWWSRTE